MNPYCKMDAKILYYRLIAGLSDPSGVFIFI